MFSSAQLKPGLHLVVPNQSRQANELTSKKKNVAYIELDRQIVLQTAKYKIQQREWDVHSAKTIVFLLCFLTQPVKFVFVCAVFLVFAGLVQCYPLARSLLLRREKKNSAVSRGQPLGLFLAGATLCEGVQRQITSNGDSQSVE